MEVEEIPGDGSGVSVIPFEAFIILHIITVVCVNTDTMTGWGRDSYFIIIRFLDRNPCFRRDTMPKSRF